MAPVSPVVPVSILRAARQKSFAIMSVPETVSPVNRPFEASPEPSLFPAVPQLKTIVLTVPAMVVPEMVVAQLRPPQVNDIAKGAAKTEVVARLGNPSTVISMSEEGRFLESLRYDWQGKWLGTVRLVNGRVALVEQP